MDASALLETLFFNRSSVQSPEGIARILGMVHLYRASGIHFLAFFTFLDWFLYQISTAWRLRVKTGKFLTLLLCLISIFWIWQLQAFRVGLIRPIATFLFRTFFKNRGAVVQIAVPLVLSFVFEWAVVKNPFTVPGAVHYYLAVAGGLMAWNRVKHQNYFVQHVFLAIGSWLPIAALDLSQDHLVSYLTPVYSLLTLPIISYFLYPFTLISILLFKTIPTTVVGLWQILLDACWALPQAGLTFISVSDDAVWGGGLLALVFVFAWTRSPWQKHFKPVIVLVLFLLGVTRWGLAARFPVNAVTQLNVGQGDAALIEQKGRREMIDVGGARAFRLDQWLRNLSRLHVLKLDGVLLSHLDEDHVGALGEITRLVEVSCVETHAEHWNSVKGTALREKLSVLSPGVKLRSEGCVRLVQPHWFLSTSAHANGNDLMAGIVHPLDEQTAYFALGDGDQTQELAFEAFFKSEIERYPHRIWKVSHHGSKFSSGREFLGDLHAETYWISAGLRNHYHHPHPLALNRLRQAGGTLHWTAVEGDLRSRVE